MLAISLSFLTPRAALLAPLALVPLAALAISAIRADRARRILRLPPPERRDRARRAVLLSLFVLLLVLATMQPVVTARRSLRERTDAETFVVLDTSRSMLAAPSSGAPTRLAAAKHIATGLALALPGVRLGVATLTDRVLPNLFPTSDAAAFDSVVQSVTIEDPPPRDVNTIATTYDALTELATEGFFSPEAHHRAVVVITDGESRAFDPASVASTLSAHGIGLAVVRVGGDADRVWRPDGKPEANYRPDPAGARIAVARLRSAAGDRAADPATFIRTKLGHGPTRVVGVEPRSRTLAPFAALLALVPLGLLLGRPLPGWLRGVTSSRRGSSEWERVT